MEDDVLDELCTVRDFVRWGASRFTEAGLCFGHGTDNAWDEAVVLVCAALHLPLDSGARALDARLTRAEKQIALEYLERRITERVPAPTSPARPGSPGCALRWTSACWCRARRLRS